MPSPPARKAARRLAAVVAILLAIVAVAVVVVILHAPHNVSHPNVSFTPPKTVPAPPKKPPVLDNFVWPLYGYNPARTRDFVGDPNLHPPFRVGWRFGGNALIEFPPVIYHRTLYFMDDGATVKAVDLETGHEFWFRHLGTLSAASPAIDASTKMLFVPVLSVQGASPGNGRFAALSMRTGRVVWSIPLSSGSESSPIVAGGLVYFGDQAGKVYALDAATGSVRWTYQAAGAVKGGLALAGGVLYFGDYAGRAYALNPQTGHQIWAVGTSGSQFGFGGGNFYSTPAVAFGRVYLGNTDGFVYSFAARTGQLGMVDVDRRLRLWVPCGRRHPRPRSDRVHRLLQRRFLRVQRAIRRDPMAPSCRRPDLRRLNRGQRRRLLLRPRLQDDDRP